MNETSASQDTIQAIRERIESIPPAMRAMGWDVSAALMNRWIHSPAWVMPEGWKDGKGLDLGTASPSHFDQTTVRMSWALSHARVRTALATLRGKLANGAAIGLLKKRTAKLVFGPDNTTTLGSIGDSALTLDQFCQVNIERFGSKYDRMDDLYGGLGIASLKVALIGKVRREGHTGRRSMQVTHAGFYVRDTYDFNGFQWLGTWTSNGALGKGMLLANTLSDGAAIRSHGKPIGNLYNHDFEAYRRLTGFGGDFIIYSDVHWERMDRVVDIP